MNLRHPLDFIPPNRRKRLLIVALVWTAMLMIVLQLLDMPLKTDEAPLGIVSFQFAGSETQSTRILLSWDSEARLSAAFGLGLDYLFMPSYAFALALAILMRHHKRDGRLAFQINAAAGWGMVFAAAFDGMENYALWLQLTDGASGALAGMAALFAALKFGLIVFGLLVAFKVLPKKWGK
jgi:hypothetical protein